jgi:hypothetical protein
VSLQIATEAFLQRPDEQTGTDPDPFKDRRSVVESLSPEVVVDKISWQQTTVVSTVTALRKEMSVTNTSVWDVPDLNGSSEITVDPRASETFELPLDRRSALLAGSPPDFADAVIVDGWLYDENGQELVHFRVRPDA